MSQSNDVLTMGDLLNTLQGVPRGLGRLVSEWSSSPAPKAAAAPAAAANVQPPAGSLSQDRSVGSLSAAAASQSYNSLLSQASPSRTSQATTSATVDRDSNAAASSSTQSELRPSSSAQSESNSSRSKRKQERDVEEPNDNSESATAASGEQSRKKQNTLESPKSYIGAVGQVVRAIPAVIYGAAAMAGEAVGIKRLEQCKQIEWNSIFIIDNGNGKEGGQGSVRRGVYGFVVNGSVVMKEVAVKERYCRNSVSKFITEIKAQSKVSSNKHVLPVIGYSCINPQGKGLRLITDWMKNGSIHDYLKEHPGRDTSRERRIAFCLGMARGVEAVHQANYKHGDIKPHNFILDDNLNVMIADFGFVDLTDSSLSYDEPLRGMTAGYAAPELPNAQVSELSDVFALGRSIWYVLEGRLPDESVLQKFEFTKAVPRDLREMIKQACADIKNRCTLQDIIDTLNQYYKKEFPNSRELPSSPSSSAPVHPSPIR